MNILEFIKLTGRELNQEKPIHIELNSRNDLEYLKKWAKTNHVGLENPIHSQLKEFSEVYALAPKYKNGLELKKFLDITIGGDISLAGEFIYFGWQQKSIFQLLPEALHYELISWRNKNKLLESEQLKLKSSCVGVIGSSVGSFASKTLSKLGIGHLRLAELKNIKPSNTPRIYCDSIRYYGEHKLAPLQQSIYEFNPYIKLDGFYEGFDKNNCEDFFNRDGKRPNLIIDAADDAATKILIREMCLKYAIPLVTGFDEKGCLIIERFDLEDFKSNSPVLDILELENLKQTDMRAYTMQLLEYFPGGYDNLSSRQKTTIEGIFNGSTGGFSQLSWEAALFGGYISKAVADILLGSQLSGYVMLDLDDIFHANMTTCPPKKLKTA